MKKYLCLTLVLAMVLSCASYAYAGTASTTITLNSSASAIDFTIPTTVSFSVSKGGRVTAPKTYTITNNLTNVKLCLIDAEFTMKSGFTILDEAPTSWSANSRNVVMDIDNSPVASTGACKSVYNRCLISSVAPEASSKIILHITTSPWTQAKTMTMASVVYTVGIVEEQNLYLVSAEKNGSPAAINFASHSEYLKKSTQDEKDIYNYGEGVIISHIAKCTDTGVQITDEDKMNRTKMGCAIVEDLGDDTVTIKMDVMDLYNIGDNVGILTTTGTTDFTPDYLGVYTVDENYCISFDVASIYAIFTVPATGSAE